MKSVVRLACAALLAATVLSAPAMAQPGAVALATHRAIYDLKLAQTRGKRPMNAVHGRILYDFSGNSCEGYALQFRQVSELDSGEGKVVVSDLRATTWEEAEAKRLRFHSQNYLNDALRDTVDGEAERANSGVDVKLSKPHDKTFDVARDIVFPTEHVRRIIDAARAGKSLLQVVVFDGSDTGDKVFDTLSVIGQPIAPDKKPDDAAAGQAALANLIRWPVTVSYFDRSVRQDAGEQTPSYAITFELYENGISRSLLLDYGDFVVSGQMTSLEIKDQKPCK